MFDLVKPENTMLVNQIITGVVVLAGLAMCYMAFVLIRRVFLAIEFVGHIIYVSPFLVGVMGLTSLGFAIGDCGEIQDNRTLGTRLIDQMGSSEKKIEAAKIIAEKPETFQQLSESTTQSKSSKQFFPRAIDGGLIGLGIGCVLYTIIIIILRTQLEKW